MCCYHNEESRTYPENDSNEDGDVGDGAVKENMYGSIQELFVKAEDLENQLQEVGSEERVCNPIVLSVLSNVATSMGLSSLKTSGETDSDNND